jgi:hypothetical protein
LPNLDGWQVDLPNCWSCSYSLFMFFRDQRGRKFLLCPDRRGGHISFVTDEAEHFFLSCESLVEHGMWRIMSWSHLASFLFLHFFMQHSSMEYRTSA